MSSFDEFLSATKCVSQRFHIDKFWAITARCQSEFVKRERCFSFTANGLRKIRNFQPFPIIIMHLRCCVDESDLLVVLALATSQLRTEPGSYFNRCVAFIGNEQNDESVTGN